MLAQNQLCRPGSPCLQPSNPRIRYHAVAFDIVGGGVKAPASMAKYNAYSPAVSNGASLTVSPGQTMTQKVTVNCAEYANSPALGVMIVTLDNAAGGGEAQTVPVASC